MKTVLFLLNTYNDIDHMTPLMYKILKEGDRIVVWFVSDYDYKNDYRIRFLKDYFSFDIFSISDNNFSIFNDSRLLLPKTRFGKVIRELLLYSYNFNRLFDEYNITSCVFEWGASYRRGFNGHFFKTAKKRNIPTFMLPHGCSTFLNQDVNGYLKKRIAKNDTPDFSRYTRFDYYVVQSQFHRTHSINWRADPFNTYAWGSARFCPEWQKKNLEICPRFIPLIYSDDLVKVVLFLPHWDYNVNKIKTMKLLDSIIFNCPYVYLVIKTHTRGSGGLDSSFYRDISNVEVVTEPHSPALVQWSDAVISFGSSIGIEVLLQNKPLINPMYLHSNKMVFDSNNSHMAFDDEHVIDYLSDVKNEMLIDISQENKDQLYKEIIYGGKEPFDVLDFYWKKITGRG